MLKKKKKYSAYVSEQPKSWKKIIILVISNGGKWHYLAIKKLSALLRRITSTYHGWFLFFILLQQQKKKLEFHKNIHENKDFSDIIMSSDDNKMLQFKQYHKSDKAPFIFYADLECTIEKIDGCKINPENLSSTKVSKYSSSGFSMSIIPSFRGTENNQDV